MSGMYGIDFAPLVLLKVKSHFFTALTGYVNDYRTFGACEKTAFGWQVAPKVPKH